MTTGRVAVAGRAAATGRVAASGRQSSILRQVPFSLGPEAFFRPDPAQITTVLGKVSVINDYMGRYSMTQGTSTKRPVLTAGALNGKPGMTFAGGQFVSTAANIQLSATAFTLVAVYKSTSNAAARTIFAPSAAGGAAFTIDANNAGKREIFLAGVGIVSDDTATLAAEVVVVDRSSSVLHMFTGTAGAAQALDFPNATPAAPSGALSVIGALNTTPVSGFVGDIYECGFYAFAFSAGQRAAYLQYVLDYYGSL